MNITATSGRLTRDPDLKTTQSGVPVCKFSLAVDRPNTNDKTDFYDFVAWRSKAEFICRNFRKGDGMEVTGYLTTNSYEDRNGNKRKVVEIVCSDVNFPKSNKAREQGVIPTEEPQGTQEPQEETANLEEVPENESLPF